MTENIDYHAFKAAMTELQAQGEPIVIELTPLEAWILLGQLQLALRHPANTGPTAEFARRFAKVIERRFAREGVLKAVAEAGWKEAHDG